MLPNYEDEQLITLKVKDIKQAVLTAALGHFFTQTPTREDFEQFKTAFFIDDSDISSATDHADDISWAMRTDIDVWHPFESMSKDELVAHVSNLNDEILGFIFDAQSSNNCQEDTDSSEMR